jgi:hypothetical protein
VHNFENMIICNIVPVNHMETFIFTLQIFCYNMTSVINGKIDFVVTNLATCLTYICEINVLINTLMAS